MIKLNSKGPIFFISERVGRYNIIFNMIYCFSRFLHHKITNKDHQHRINFDVLENWKGFGGIRIEDDIRVTSDQPENLTQDIPKEIVDIERIMKDT